MASPASIGPYTVTRVLGQGGMGTVYEVRDPHLQRPLALKLIRSHSAGPTALERFWREAEALAKVHHHGVVRIHELGEVPEGPYIVQELIEGESLDVVSARRPPPEPREAARIVSGLADALGAIHAQGILHRDLKPANVILRPDGIPVLLDFGLAREVAAESLTKTGAMLGTPAYMSPEQARGEKGPGLDERTDVYGLGTVLYELLCGRSPFVAATPLELMGQLLYEDPPWPRAERKDVPAPLDAICRMAMAKRLEDRYPSARAFKDDLDAFLAGAATRASAAQRRGRRWITVGALAALLLGVAGFLASSSNTQEGPTTALPASDPPATPAAVLATPTPVLWSLEPGERFALRFRYDERDQLSRLFIDLDLQASALKVEGALATVECRFRRARGVVGSTAIGAGGQAYDSDQDDPEHFMAGLGQTVGHSFTFRIDRTTGRVTELRGMEPIIGKMVAATRRSPMGITVQWLKNHIALTFSDEHLREVFDSLLAVRAEAERLPWRSQAERRGEDAGQRFLMARAAVPFVIEPAYRTQGLKPEHRYRIEGQAIFESQRLRSSRIVQDVVGREAQGLMVPVSPETVSHLDASLEQGDAR